MKESGKWAMTVHGRISNVTWLEQAPYNATKERDGKFYCYRLEVSEGLYKDLVDDLEGTDKVWIKDFPLMEREEPHPAYAAIAAALTSNPKLQRQLETGSLFFNEPDNDECEEFALKQIEKLRQDLEIARKSSLAEEVIRIAHEVCDRGGDAYGEYKSRLQEIMKAVK